MKLTKERLLTIAVAIGLSTIMIVVLYDLWLYETEQTTISDFLTAWGPIARPMVLFAFGAASASTPAFILGLLAGHWWWPNSYIPEEESGEDESNGA